MSQKEDVKELITVKESTVTRFRGRGALCNLLFPLCSPPCLIAYIAEEPHLQGQREPCQLCLHGFTAGSTGLGTALLRGWETTGQGWGEKDCCPSTMGRSLSSDPAETGSMARLGSPTALLGFTACPLGNSCRECELGWKKGAGRGAFLNKFEICEIVYANCL